MHFSADRIFDGNGRVLPGAKCIGVRNGLISTVSCASVSTDSVMLAGCSLMPGLIDLHGYLSIDPDRPDPMGQMSGNDMLGRGWTAAANLRRDIFSGVTTLRAMGEGPGPDGRPLDVAAKAAIAEGLLAGPNIVTSGPPVCASASHQAPPTGGADGVDAVRAAVARNVAAGTDWIKVTLTGGVNSSGGGATTALYSEAEFAAACEAAAAAGRPLAVAAHGGAGIAMALKYGARTIEHGALLAASEIALIAKHGAYLVLTLGRFFDPEGIERSAAGNHAILSRLAEARTALRKTVPLAIEAGVKVVLGTDNMHGRLWSDVRWLQKLGAPFAFALAAATGRAANALGLENRIGSIRAGMQADFIAVAGDPGVSDIGVNNVQLVVKAGRIEWVSPRIGCELERHDLHQGNHRAEQSA